jgi:SNF2 family DNA or RNA helicase
LGKTAQSIATLAFQRQFLGITGPHIVIAPLTTLGHWQREIETWTGMVRTLCLQRSSSYTFMSCSEAAQLLQAFVIA